MFVFLISLYRILLYKFLGKMKKISLALIAAMAILFASCGGKTTEKAEEKVEEKIEATTEAATEVVTEEATEAESSLVGQYSALLDKYLPLVEKVKGGDVTAAAEVAKVAQEIQKFATDNQEALKNLSEADAKKFEELAQKFADAMK